MPFKETCVSDDKLRFIAVYLRGEQTMTSLCEVFGISREWGYRLLRCYQADGPSGLSPWSRAPHRHGRAMADAVVDRIVDLRLARPHWGPKKLRAVLERDSPELAWPAPSTIGDLLRRAGLSEPRRRRRRPAPPSRCRPAFVVNHHSVACRTTRNPRTGPQ